MEPAQRALYDRIIAQRFPKQTQHDWRSAIALAASKQAIDKAVALDPTHPDTMAKIASLLYAQLAVDCPEVLGVNCKSAKLEALKEFLTEEDTTSQVVIYTRFEQVATVITRHLRELKIPTVRITGKEDAAKSRAAQLEFQTGTSRVCIITSAGGESIDLQAGRILVFYDLPWAFGEFQQVLGRVRRVGSPHGSVLLLLLGTSHTIDSITLSILQKKEKLVAATFTLKDLLLTNESFEATVINAPVPDTVLRSASITSDAFVHSLFDLMQTA
jgi:superfamily II DNA/RNA helicase